MQKFISLAGFLLLAGQFLPDAKQVPDYEPPSEVKSVVESPLPLAAQDSDEEIPMYKPDWYDHSPTWGTELKSKVDEIPTKLEVKKLVAEELKSHEANMLAKIETLLTSISVPSFGSGPVGTGEELHPNEVDEDDAAQVPPAPTPEKAKDPVPEAEAPTRIDGVGGRYVDKQVQVGTQTQTYSAYETVYENRMRQVCMGDYCRQVSVSVPVRKLVTRTREVPKYETQRVWQEFSEAPVEEVKAPAATVYWSTPIRYISSPTTFATDVVWSAAGAGCDCVDCDCQSASYSYGSDGVVSVQRAGLFSRFGSRLGSRLRSRFGRW